MENHRVILCAQVRGERSRENYQMQHQETEIQAWCRPPGGGPVPGGGGGVRGPGGLHSAQARREVLRGQHEDGEQGRGGRVRGARERGVQHVRAERGVERGRYREIGIL